MLIELEPREIELLIDACTLVRDKLRLVRDAKPVTVKLAMKSPPEMVK